MFADLAGQVVAAQGGEVIELRGDEALAVFGSARRALRGAVELQRRFRTQTDGRPVFPLGIGIGLDSGEAIARFDGTRASVLRALHMSEVKDGILGTFRFDASGDKTPEAITIYGVTGKTPPGASLASEMQGAVVNRVVSVPSSMIP